MIHFVTFDFQGFALALEGLRSNTSNFFRDRMPLRRNRRQYGQLTDFDRGRIIQEAGWSNRRIGRHLGRSDMVVAR
ncbi:hypothetical protein TNCV_2611801 [Trichonephila clavipes]|nr:hypothetical protein TNCV_2611801 [Trichonephila clavipes]